MLECKRCLFSDGYLTEYVFERICQNHLCLCFNVDDVRDENRCARK